MERGLEGGQRPHNRPLSPARRAQGERQGKKGRKRKDAGCSRDEQHHASPHPPGPGVRFFSGRARTPGSFDGGGPGVRTKGNTLDLTSYRPPTGIPRPEGTRGESWKEGEKTERCRWFPQDSGREERSVKREGLRVCGGLPNKPWRRPTFPHKSMQYHGR